MTNNPEHINDILEKAFAMRKEGKSTQEILRAFPGFEKELADIFSALERLAEARSELSPSPEAVHRIVTRLVASARDNERRVTPPFFLRLKFALPIGAMALAIILFVIIGSAQRSRLAENPQKEKGVLPEQLAKKPRDEQIIATTTPNGKEKKNDTNAHLAINTAVDDMLASLDEEQSAWSEESAGDASSASDMPDENFDALFSDDEI